MRAFFADTLALVVFFTLTGVINERVVAGMEWEEVLRARLIGAPLMVLTARPYGLWRDRVLAMAPEAGGIRKTALDAAALMAFQVPLYVAIIAAGGARGDELVRGGLGGAAMMLALGRPYGLWLDFVRARFGLRPGGMRPMSLGR